MARFVSLLVLVAILVIISIIFFQVMAGFFVPLFLAALLGVVVQPLYTGPLGVPSDPCAHQLCTQGYASSTAQSPKYQPKPPKLFSNDPPAGSRRVQVLPPSVLR